MTGCRVQESQSSRDVLLFWMFVLAVLACLRALFFSFCADFLLTQQSPRLPLLFLAADAAALLCSSCSA